MLDDLTPPEEGGYAGLYLTEPASITYDLPRGHWTPASPSEGAARATTIAVTADHASFARVVDHPLVLEIAAVSTDKRITLSLSGAPCEDPRSVSSLAFAPDDGPLALVLRGPRGDTFSARRALRLYDRRGRRCALSLERAGLEVTVACFHPGSSSPLLVVGERDGHVAALRLDGKCVGRAKVFDDEVVALSVAREGEVVIASAGGGLSRLRIDPLDS